MQMSQRVGQFAAANKAARRAHAKRLLSRPPTNWRSGKLLCHAETRLPGSDRHDTETPARHTHAAAFFYREMLRRALVLPRRLVCPSVCLFVCDYIVRVSLNLITRIVRLESSLALSLSSPKHYQSSPAEHLHIPCRIGVGYGKGGAFRAQLL